MWPCPIAGPLIQWDRAAALSDHQKHHLSKSLDPSRSDSDMVCSGFGDFSFVYRLSERTPGALLKDLPLKISPMFMNFLILANVRHQRKTSRVDEISGRWNPTQDKIKGPQSQLDLLQSNYTSIRTSEKIVCPRLGAVSFRRIQDLCDKPIGKPDHLLVCNGEAIVLPVIWIGHLFPSLSTKVSKKHHLCR